MRNTRFGTRKLIFEDGSGVWLRRRHCRRGSGDKEVLGGGFEAVVVIAAITEDHQRTKGDSKLEEALNAWNILFDSGDEAEEVICWESARGSGALESLTLRVRAAALNIAALNLAKALNGHKGLMRGLQTSSIATANSGLRASQVGMKGR